MQILAVDPHVRHMAWAIIDTDAETSGYASRAVVDVGILKAKRALSQQECQDYWAAYALNPSLVGKPPFAELSVHLVIETPDHLKNKSNKQLCDLVALGMCAAAFCQGWSQCKKTVRTYDQVKPREWKGRTTKQHTADRVRMLCGKKSEKWTDHQMDAVALGMWWCRKNFGPKVQVAA
mgnify:CR=1 FL=1|jgi:Holliday junction resolvasome RuvABC endonuclease subunit|tara:strand:+ start:2827 stop:3360 length:534 start_codon:yes stop_codon:yes gene_type:complete